MAGRATLSAVAARAGVSPSTASLAFAGSPKVAPATLERVLRAADEFGYAGPDPVAASLRTGRSGVVGAVGRRAPAVRVPRPGRRAAAGRAHRGAGHARGRAAAAGRRLDAVRAHPGAARPAAAGRRGVRHLRAGGRPGASGCCRRGGCRWSRSRGRWFRGAAGRHRGPAGTATLARHLAGLGHRDVAMVTMPLRLDGRRGPVNQARLAAGVYRDTGSGCSVCVGVPGRAGGGDRGELDRGGRAGRPRPARPAPGRPR